MELRHLRYFVMAAEEANISRAAARLNVSQPAVSRQIKDLEEELGAPLFIRQRQGLRLTDAGETALAHAREVLRQSNTLVESLRAFGGPGRSVSLKIGFIPTALPGFFGEGLRKFNRSRPDVRVQIHEMSPREQEEALRGGEIDLALLGSACLQLKREFKVAAIRKCPMAAVVSDDHRLAGRKSIDLAELGQDKFLSLQEKHFPGRSELMAELFERAGINPKITMRASGLTEILGLVGAGAGVAVVPRDLDQLSHCGVVFLKLKRPRLTLVFSAVWRRGDHRPEIDALVELLREGEK